MQVILVYEAFRYLNARVACAASDDEHTLEA
jgi:hypothetical protein